MCKNEIIIEWYCTYFSLLNKLFATRFFENTYVCIVCTHKLSSLNIHMYITVPSCYITPRCIGEPVNKSITFYDCCKSYGVAFDLDGRCQPCPSTSKYL